MKTRVLLLGAAAMLALGTANAGHNHGWYIGIEGGANWVDDVDGVFFSGPLSTSATVELDTGWAVLGTVGYSFHNNWRLELEGGYRSNGLDGGAADLNEWSIMANVVYDLPLSPKWDLNLGVGVGYDHATFDGAVDIDDGNIAYQGIAGLSYAIGRQTDLALTYRYLRISEPEFEFAGGLAGFHFDDVSKHTVTIGLRFDLSPDEVAAPPAPMPVPPPRAQDFTIFFGFGKCNITQEADAVLAEAAASARAGNSTSVRIVGHTDTVGSARSNQRLSECRADAAKSNLVAKGVSSRAISTSGAGETSPMVQTGDNVKEPQNRRVQIRVN
jgi:outer membrane protein OmpA-like peptidoglycan-associated protein